LRYALICDNILPKFHIDMSNHNLTANQEEIYLIIRQYISQDKHATYLREIQRSCSIKSHKVESNPG